MRVYALLLAFTGSYSRHSGSRRRSLASPIGRSLAFGRAFAFPLLLNPHDARAHLDLVADIRTKVAHDACVGGDQRVLHLHRLDDGQALARFDSLAFPDRDRDEAARY